MRCALVFLATLTLLAGCAPSEPLVVHQPAPLRLPPPPPGPVVRPVDEPLARLQAFLVDYAEWERTRPSPDAERTLSDNFLDAHEYERTGRVPARPRTASEGAHDLGVLHGLTDDLVLRDGLISASHSVHNPGEVVLETTTVAPDHVVVLTRAAPRSMFGGRYRYELRRVAGDWRIAAITHDFTDEAPADGAAPR